jgi:hypothetical protein
MAAGLNSQPSTINTQLFRYQLALRTPGIKPWSASLRKQMRQMPNLRYTARGRPQSLQRFSRRVLNLGSALALAILDLLATGISLFGSCRLSALSCQPISVFYILAES